jgi:hypothetical protein
MSANRQTRCQRQVITVTGVIFQDSAQKRWDEMPVASLRQPPQGQAMLRAAMMIALLLHS